MSIVHEAARETRVAGDYDVVVCGGGPAGVAAALAAAAGGAKTCLVEVHGCLGGVWTAGCLAWILDHENKAGLMTAIFDRLKRYNARTFDADGSPTNAYDVERMKLVLDELCLEAGVEIRLHTRIVAALLNDADRLTHVLTESASGRQALSASVFIDCTGNGDLGAQAGCGFDIGHPTTGETQPFSLLCLVTGVDVEAMRPYTRQPGDEWGGPKERLRQQMVLGGHDPSYNKPSLFRVRDDLYFLMANHEYGFSGISSEDVTAATVRARVEVHQLIDGLRSLGEPWSNLQIVATGAQIGIREGRRLHGLYTVTEEDLRDGARHEDAVCRVTFGIDVHSTNAKKGTGIEAPPFRSQPYDIPLRALIARKVDGLMMAGRCISGDFLAHSSYRVTGNSVALGEAAGRTAAEAVQRGLTPRELVEQSAKG